MADITEVLAIRDFLKFSNRKVASIYDPLWWHYATSDYDDPYAANHMEDVGLRKMLNFTDSQYEEYMSIDADERLEYLKTILQRGVTASEPVLTKSTWTTRGPLNAKYLVDVGVEVNDHDTRLVDLLTSVGVTVGNSTASSVAPLVEEVEEDTSEFDHTLVLPWFEARVSNRIYEKYVNTTTIYEDKVYTLKRLNTTGEGVLICLEKNRVFDDFYYNGGDAELIPQATIRVIDNPVCVDVSTGEKHRMVFAIFDKIKGTLGSVLKSAFRVNEREDLMDRVIDAIQGYSAKLMHGSLSQKDILVTEDDRVIFTNFKHASHIGGYEEHPQLRAWVASGYLADWDMVCLFSEFFMNDASDLSYADFIFTYVFNTFKRRTAGTNILKPVLRGFNVTMKFNVTQHSVISAKYVVSTKVGERTISLSGGDPHVTNVYNFRHRSQRYTLDISLLTEQGIKLGSKLSNGSYGTVHKIGSRRVAKLGKIKKTERLVQMEAARLGFAPTIHGFFELPVLSIDDNAPITSKASKMPVLIMDAMTMTVEDYLKALSTTEDDAITVLNRLYDVVTRFAQAGFMHHDLKLDNVMIKKRRKAPPEVYIIDYGKAWYAGVKQQLPYGTFLREDGTTKIKSSKFNVVAWMNYATPRNASKLYDGMCLFKEICRKYSRNHKSALILGEQSPITRKLMEALSDVLTKYVLGEDMNTVLKLKYWNPAIPEVRFVYVERPRMDRETGQWEDEDTIIWDVGSVAETTWYQQNADFDMEKDVYDHAASLAMGAPKTRREPGPRNVRLDSQAITPTKSLRDDATPGPLQSIFENYGNEYSLSSDAPLPPGYMRNKTQQGQSLITRRRLLDNLERDAHVTSIDFGLGRLSAEIIDPRRLHNLQERQREE